MAVEIGEANVGWMRTGRRLAAKACEAPSCNERALPRENYCALHLREIDGWP